MAFWLSPFSKIGHTLPGLLFCWSAHLHHTQASFYTDRASHRGPLCALFRLLHFQSLYLLLMMLEKSTVAWHIHHWEQSTDGNTPCPHPTPVSGSCDPADCVRSRKGIWTLRPLAAVERDQETSGCTWERPVRKFIVWFVNGNVNLGRLGRTSLGDNRFRNLLSLL